MEPKKLQSWLRDLMQSYSYREKVGRLEKAWFYAKAVSIFSGRMVVFFPMKWLAAWLVKER